MIDIADICTLDHRTSKPGLHQDLEYFNKKFKLLIQPEWITDKSILDLGCGVGIAAKASHDLGCKSYIGLDVVLEEIDKARVYFKGYSNISFYCDDVRQFPSIIDGKFDTIILAGMLHVFKNPFSLLDDVIAADPEYIVIETAHTNENGIRYKSHSTSKGNLLYTSVNSTMLDQYMSNASYGCVMTEMYDYSKGVVKLLNRYTKVYKKNSLIQTKFLESVFNE